MLNVMGNIQLNPQFIGGDKSFSHRALILAALATSPSTISNLSVCDDVLATADCLNKLGAKITIEQTTATVLPIKTPNRGVTLNCKNSGTTARLLMGVVCGLNVSATFVGDESLAARPMKRVAEPLAKMGANISFQPSGESGFLFSVESSQGLFGKTLYAEVNSAQVKSAVLLAGLFAQGETTYVEQIPTRSHTEKALEEFGVCHGTTVVGKKRYGGFNVSLPSDISSAAYLIALAVAKNIPLTINNVCLSDRRIGFLRVLKVSSANVDWHVLGKVFGEPVGTVTVGSGNKLRPMNMTEEDVADAIDEIPLLCCLSMLSVGESRFCGVSELKIKESDRLAAIVSIASRCNKQAFVEGSDLVISSNGKLPKYVYFDCSEDHRIQMCQVVTAAIAGGGRVPNVDGVSVSFPSFFKCVAPVFKRFAVIGSDVTHSLSPALMCFFARELNMWLSYSAVSLGENASDDKIIQTISAFDGVNVTIPYKNRVAKLFGSDCSVNTVWNGKACSTDDFGIVAALDAHGIDFRGKQLLIVGAGGAAEQAVIALKNCGCKLSVLNRTQSRADELAAKYGLSSDAASPVGVLSFVPQCDWEKSLELPDSVKFVFVAAYGGKSHIANVAKRRKLCCVCGEEMLYYQGAKSLSLWLNDSRPMQIDGYKRFKCGAHL